ncbi:MAG: hypothetical protein AB1592_11535 [Pseudomonadota bacterium]
MEPRAHRLEPGAPLPPFSFRAFSATPATHQAVRGALLDPRLRRLAAQVEEGGIAAACGAFAPADTPPDALLVELDPGTADPMAQLERLAAACPRTALVFVVGHDNDVRLYQKLVREGARDYLLAPLSAQELADCLVRDLATLAAARREGSSVFVLASRGGAGATTVAANLAVVLSRDLRRRTVLADLRHPFGAVAAHMDAVPVPEAADFLHAPEDLDQDVMARLLVAKAPMLDLLIAESGLERAARAGGRFALERSLALLRASHDMVVCDAPQGWSRALELELDRAGDVVLVIPPDFAGAANAQALVKRLAVLRGERRPFLVLNQCGLPRRPELTPEDVARILGCRVEDFTVIAHDARAFGESEQTGRVLCERAPHHPGALRLAALAARLAGAPLPQRPRLAGLRLGGVLAALRQRFA